MAIVHMSHELHPPRTGKFLASIVDIGRVAFMLLGPVGLLALAIIGRYAVFEYFHGSEQTLRALWHVFCP